MILAYSFIGLALAGIGGAAPGASNIAVLTTTTKHSLQKGMRVAIGAGIGELVLALLALCYSSFFIHFFEMNLWTQIVFTSVFFIIGAIFYSLKNLRFLTTLPIKNSISNSSLLKGFLLSLINPPVLLFWILGISLTQQYLLPLTDMSPSEILVLFFTGVFMGKVAILYGYAKLGKGLKERKKTNAAQMNKIIGITFMILALVQGVRLFL